MVQGLEDIHNAGIIHRDLKPMNIIFDKDGYCKISDFGISKRWAPGTIINSYAGTRGYMAPEIIFRRNYNTTVDYYSLGVILGQCMKGSFWTPYRGKDEM